MPTTNLGITHIDAAQNQKEVTANEAFDHLDEALTNRLQKGITDGSDTVLDTAVGGEALANLVYQMTGTLTANRNMVVPTNKKVYVCQNATTGGFSVTVKTAAGSGIAVAPGETRILYCNGTNVVELEVKGSRGIRTFPFGHAAAHAGTPPATLQLEVVDGSTTVDSSVGYRQVRAGSVVGVSVQLEVAGFTAGDTIDVEVRVGASTTLTAQIAAPAGNGYYGAQATAPLGTYAASAGSVVGARLTFGGSANFTVQNVAVVVEVAV